MVPAIQRMLKHKDAHRRISPDEPELLARWDLFKRDKGSVANELSTPRSQEQHVGTIKSLLADTELSFLSNKHIRYAVRSRYARGNQERALEYLTLIDDSVQGIIRSYAPETKLLGAENKGGVSCYLDSALFAMFARLDFYEALLYNDFSTPLERNLIVLLRLWVNMLRSGKLIPTDITTQLQNAIAACGWREAGLPQQQDASEAFTFLMETLKSPLLTLKMDLIHNGQQNATYDHQFVNERLLEVAIPEPIDDTRPITLEDCLEQHFNSRVEVRRYLETQSNADLLESGTKGFSTQHIEVADAESPRVISDPDSAYFSAPKVHKDIPQVKVPDGSPIGRDRASSIVRNRFVSEGSDTENDEPDDTGVNQKGSVHKEVMMPAWQVFSLLPWYTDNRTDDNSQTAAHFSAKRPILGIALKRYSVLPSGETVRLGTYIDIPVEIGFPHFINDDQMREDGPLYGKFKLSLQSAICHRGSSVNSGHYIALVRGTNNAPDKISTQDGASITAPKSNYWMRFDDLASERITLANIDESLRDESPYLLFYQILPIDADPANPGPPSFDESSNIRIPLSGKLAGRLSDSSSGDESGPAISRPTSSSRNVHPGDAPDDVENTLAIPMPPPRDPTPPVLDSSTNTPKQSKSRQSSMAESRIGSLFSRRKSAEPLSTGEGWRFSGEHRRAKSAERQRSKERAKEVKQREVALRKAKGGPQRECVVM
ncbi:hypothetical protein FQN49_001214 [Arthroderma sp. PD_2]|nr:hypothetical protein FQN49_001214 [Arthroderma sp. PD_2]